MSPPQQEFTDAQICSFSNITTILYLACCYTDISSLKSEFNWPYRYSHTSSAVRRAAREIISGFYTIDNIIESVIRALPMVGQNNGNVHPEIARYIIPYVYNQLCEYHGDNETQSLETELN